MSCKTSLFFGLISFFFLSCSVPRQLEKKEELGNFDRYIEERNKLLLSDSLLYFDRQVQLNPLEERLNRQLIDLQQKMIETYKADHFFPPARNFYQSKRHIEESLLFKVIQKMPKGGILHLHSGAMGDARWLIQKAIETPEMYVFWETSNEKFVKGQLQAFSPATVPSGFQQVNRLAKEEESFPNELLDLLTFDEEMDRDSVDIWAEFENVFQRINGFITYRKIAEEILNHGVDLLIEDNIQHAEFRTFFGSRYYDLDGSRMSNQGYIDMLERVLQYARQKDPAFTFHLIQQSLRFFDADTIWAHMKRAHRYRTEYPQWIRGFDLVAEEDAGHTTLFHAAEFLKLDSLERKTGVDLPLFLHDGESDWAGTANLYDAVLLGTKRIGHGFNLFRFPHLMDLVRDENICVEVNPLSNQILGYIRDLRLHPASTYLRRGIDCVISSDDPMIFDYRGLSYDFWSVFLAWELDLAALKKLSRNSLEYAAFTEPEKQKALENWDKRWRAFVQEALEIIRTR